MNLTSLHTRESTLTPRSIPSALCFRVQSRSSHHRGRCFFCSLSPSHGIRLSAPTADDRRPKTRRGILELGKHPTPAHTRYLVAAVSVFRTPVAKPTSGSCSDLVPHSKYIPVVQCCRLAADITHTKSLLWEHQSSAHQGQDKTKLPAKLSTPTRGADWSTSALPSRQRVRT
jgi:hypothetical protein